MVVDALRIATVTDEAGVNFGYLAVDNVEYKMSQRRGLRKIRWDEIKTRGRLVFSSGTKWDEFFFSSDELPKIEDNLFEYAGARYRLSWLATGETERIYNEYFQAWL